MLDVGGFDAVGAGEVEVADDADAFGNVPVDAGHLGVAGGEHERGVKASSRRPTSAWIGEAVGQRRQPDVLQGSNLAAAGRRRAERATAASSRITRAGS